MLEGADTSTAPAVYRLLAVGCANKPLAPGLAVTWASFWASCAEYARFCKAHPPQVPKYGQGGCTRWSCGRRTLTLVAVA